MAGRILIVGPIGATPWMPARDVAVTLRGQGLDVDLHNPATGDEVITYPDPYNPSRKVDALLPIFLLHRLRAFLRWRRKTRRVMGAYRSVLVWDPLVAVMLRLALPRATRIVWTRTAPVVDDAWNAVLARAAGRLCDRTIDGGDWFTEIGA